MNLKELVWAAKDAAAVVGDLMGDEVLPVVELEREAPKLSTSKIQHLLKRDVAMLNDIAADRMRALEERREIEKLCAEAAADDPMIPSIVPVGVYEKAADHVMERWLTLAKRSGLSVVQLEVRLRARIDTLREILRQCRARDGEPAEMLAARARLREAVVALADASGALEGHRRRMAILAHHLGTPESVTDRKRADELSAKVTAAEQALEAATAELRGHDPEAA